MDIRYILEFVVLAEVGNYLETADLLYMSQSTLSRHIKSLEESLGVPLFERTTRKVHLSEFGKTFLPYAKEIDKIHAAYKKALERQLNDSHYSVTVGSIPVMAHYYITDVFIEFQKQHPNFSLNVHEADSNELIPMLRENKCDFAFLRETDDSHNEFEKIPFATDHLAAIFPMNHPLAKAVSINLEQIKDENFLLLKPDTLMYTLCMDACKKAGFEPNITFTGRRSENIIDFVSKGMGVALLMKKAAEYDVLANVAVVDIEPKISSSINLAFSPSYSQNLACRKFMELIEEKNRS